MTRGPAGYGRYDDDPVHVGCPWARSSESPCMARDGRTALAGPPDPVCVTCAHEPSFLIEDLAEDYPPAQELLTAGDPYQAADQFALMVREATG